MGKQVKMYDYVCKHCEQPFRTSHRGRTICQPCIDKLEAMYSKCTVCGKALSPVKYGTNAFLNAVNNKHRYCSDCLAETIKEKLKSDSQQRLYEGFCSVCKKTFPATKSKATLCENCESELMERFANCTRCGTAMDKPKKQNLTKFLKTGHRYCPECVKVAIREANTGRGSHNRRPPRKPVKPKLNINDCLREAQKQSKATGRYMTYGQYVQMLEAQNEV